MLMALNIVLHYTVSQDEQVNADKLDIHIYGGFFMRC